MSSADPRWVVVDDENPLIQYQGQWAVGNTPDPIFGDPFNNTLHQLSGSSGSFTFNFTGSSLSVMGSFSNGNAEDIDVPSWNCTVIGVGLIPNANPGNRSHWEICALSDISTSAPSNLTVTALGTVDNPFQFDFIKYVPDASVILNNATVLVDVNDTQIRYSPGWSAFKDIGMQTSANGSSMTLDFIGVQVTWVITLDSSLPVTLAKYSIDGGTLFPFQVDNSEDSSFILYNQVSFQTPGSPALAPGPHSLYVQYSGDSTTTPLVLDYLVIQNLTIPPVTPPSPLGPGPVIPGSTLSQHAGLSKGAVAGIIIGSLVGLSLAIISLIWVRNQKLTAAPFKLGLQAKKSKRDVRDGKDKMVAEP